MEARGETKEMEALYKDLIEKAEKQFHYDLALNEIGAMIKYKSSVIAPTKENLNDLLSDAHDYEEALEKLVAFVSARVLVIQNGMIRFFIDFYGNDEKYLPEKSEITFDLTKHTNPLQRFYLNQNKYFQSSPEDRGKHLERALIEVRKGRKAGRKDLEAAKQSVLNNLSLYYHDLHMYEKADDAMDEIINGDFKNLIEPIYIHAFVAKVYAKRFDKALDFYDRYKDKLKDKKSVGTYLATIHLYLRNPGKVFKHVILRPRGEAPHIKSLHYCVSILAWFLNDLNDEDNITGAENDIRNAKRAISRLPKEDLDLDYLEFVNRLTNLFKIVTKEKNKREKLLEWKMEFESFYSNIGKLSQQNLLVLWIREEIDNIIQFHNNQ